MAEKRFEDDDPMVLVAAGVPGDDADAAESFIDEFVRLGFSDEQLLELFRNPFYQATHRIFRTRGEAFVTSLIVQVRERWSRPVRPSAGRPGDE